MKCPACQENLADNAKFCGKCGQKIPRCPTCGAPVLTRSKYCGKDGTALPQELLDLLPGGAAPETAVPKTPETGMEMGFGKADELEKENEKGKGVEKLEVPKPSSTCERCGAPCGEGRRLCASCVSELRRKRAEEQQRQTPKKYCAMCGCVVTDGQKVCAACRQKASGTRVRTDADSEGSGGKKNTAVIIAVAAAVILLIAIVVCVFLAKGKSGDKPKEALSQNDQQSGSSWFADSEEEAEETAAPEWDFFAPETMIEETAAPETIPETEPPTQAPTEAPTEPEVDEDARVLYFLNYCDSKYLDESDVEGFDEEMCRIARNGIYAKSGRMFKDTALQEYYEQYDWYYPSVSPSNFTASMLNEYQNANLNLIMNYERAHGYR